jgi:hypothetical protein
MSLLSQSDRVTRDLACVQTSVVWIVIIFFTIASTIGVVWSCFRGFEKYNQMKMETSGKHRQQGVEMSSSKISEDDEDECTRINVSGSTKDDCKNKRKSFSPYSLREPNYVRLLHLMFSRAYVYIF